MGFIKVGVVLFASLLVGMANASNGNKNNNNKTENKMTVTELTQEDFVKKVYDFETNPNAWKFEGDKPAVIDFYATWCGPCKMMSPILDEISKEYEGKINVYKVNVDKEADLASVFGFRQASGYALPHIDHSSKTRHGLHDLVDYPIGYQDVPVLHGGKGDDAAYLLRGQVF